MNILADTGFWIALYDKRDSHHEKALYFWEKKYEYKYIVPYPSLYELVNTRLMRRKDSLDFFSNIFHDTSQTEIVSDEKYKAQALSMTLKNIRNISLVDCVIRMMLEDDDIFKNAVISTNKNDFIDVCLLKQIEFIEI